MKTIIKNIKIIIIYLAFLFSRGIILYCKKLQVLYDNFQEKTDRSNKTNLLFVSFSPTLGDSIVGLTFIYNYEKTIKNNNTYYVINKKFQALFKNILNSPNIIYVDRKKYKLNLFYRIKALRQLSQLNLLKAYNISIDRGPINDELTLFSDATEKICFSTTSYYLTDYILKLNNFNYSVIRDFKTVNEHQKLENLFLELTGSVDYKLTSANIKNDLNQKKTIVIAPYSSSKIKDWGIERYFILAEKLATNYIVIFMGNNNPNAKIFLKYNNENIKTAFGINDEREFYRTFSESELFIGNDSGLLHLSLLLDIKSIGIIGGGFFDKFYNYTSSKKQKFMYYKLDCFNCRWNCKFDQTKCLTNVSVEEVYKEAIRLLKLDE